MYMYVFLFLVFLETPLKNEIILMKGYFYYPPFNIDFFFFVVVFFSHYIYTN